MKLYKARVKTEKELLASGWKTIGQEYYSSIALDGHITSLMSLNLGKTIKLEYDGENEAGIKWYKQIDSEWYWREDMLTDICEFEETKNICLTPLEIEKIRTCIESKITQYKGRSYYTDEQSGREANEAIEFYTKLASKFEV